MTVHPQIRAALAALAEANLPAIETLTPERAREVFNAMSRARGGTPAPIAKAEDHVAEAEGLKVPVRIYWPEGVGPHPAFVFFHGGGHVIGDVETHDKLARNLCGLSGAVVVSVDYRLAPEHRFPAAIEDGWAAYEWVRRRGADLGIDPSRLAVGGDSAGGNIAAVVAIMARDAGYSDIRLQVLVYPVADFTFGHDSHRRFAEGYGILTADAMRWFRDHYLSAPDDARDWRASPLFASDFGGLPAAFVATADCDVLSDEGTAYAEALRAAGAVVEHREYRGMIHGFLAMTPAIDDAARAQADVAAALKAAFAREPAS
ncbi:alpha/beta hydrolase [Enterovirga rhinocerotis]|uniref:Acetyl esterase n=1 Tax=Enterovirga rhinocerotis TaxID=1339210 RepID=A0A4R7C136_9HYPH|nr:alpha/beta hydrolase [Enterovirga rhinocerotis]TDR90207.1 acetyl esterase [Enterovirga rhinocerotis]